MIQSYKLCKAMCAGLVILALFSALPALAVTIPVTNTNDSGEDSLRWAIGYALDGDEIIFDLDFSTPQTITLTSGELVINKDLTISGPSAEELAISGNHASRVFHITGYFTVVSISGVTIKDGQTSSECGWSYGGGGICIEWGGRLTLTNSTVSGNSATLGYGGGIYSHWNGTVTVTNSTLSGNSAPWGCGGISNYYGTTTLTDSTLSGNSGGICSEGTLTLSNSTVSGNSSSGIAHSGMLTLTNSTVSGNSAVAAYGYDSYGGGIYNNGGGTMTLINSTVSGNRAVSAYGGLGGGIYHYLGTLTLINSTVSGNSATAGGGVFNRDGEVNLTNSTLAGNSATYSGGIYSYAASFNASDTVTLKNTLLANRGNCYVAGTLISQGYNLSSDTSCSLHGPGDLNNTAPRLDPGGLKDNGGPTHTIALLSTSPAVDRIPASDCTDVAGNPVTTDQRGVERPQGPACDIGAFEGSLPVTNQPPVANAGPDQTGIAYVALTFNGSASFDPDGAIVSYQWNLGDFTTVPGKWVSHAYSTAGTYWATLTVTDDAGATGSDTAQVTIQTPAQATTALISNVQGLGLARGIEQALSATLQAALASINHGDQLAKLAAINQLQAFIYQVSALQGVKLTPEQATSLIQAAQQIIESLSSSP